MKFDDIYLSLDFIEDYDNAPIEIKNTVNSKLSVWAITRKLPPSAQAHKAKTYDSIWIVYLNKGKGGWRLLVCVSDRKMTFLRLLNHSDMEHQLRI